MSRPIPTCVGRATLAGCRAIDDVYERERRGELTGRQRRAAIRRAAKDLARVDLVRAVRLQAAQRARRTASRA